MAAGPASGQDLQVLAGVGFGPFRNPPRRIYASLELNQKLDGSPIGVWAAADADLGQGYYLGLGALAMAGLGPRWQLALGFGPGYYTSHAELNLGSELEFRSSLYLSRRLESGRRLGLSVSHYSNGGLARHNPGAETVRVYYQIPVPW